MKRVTGKLISIKETFKKDTKGNRTDEKNGYQLSFFKGDETISLFTKEEVNRALLNEFLQITSIENNIQKMVKLNNEAKEKFINKMGDEDESEVIEYLDKVIIKKLIEDGEIKNWNNETKKMEVVKYKGVLVQVQNPETGNIGRIKVKVDDFINYEEDLKKIINQTVYVTIKETIKQSKAASVLVTNFKDIIKSK